MLTLRYNQLFTNADMFIGGFIKLENPYMLINIFSCKDIGLLFDWLVNSQIIEESTSAVPIFRDDLKKMLDDNIPVIMKMGSCNVALAVGRYRTMVVCYPFSVRYE